MKTCNYTLTAHVTSKPPFRQTSHSMDELKPLVRLMSAELPFADEVLLVDNRTGEVLFMNGHEEPYATDEVLEMLADVTMENFLLGLGLS